LLIALLCAAAPAACSSESSRLEAAYAAAGKTPGSVGTDTGGAPAASGAAGPAAGGMSAAANKLQSMFYKKQITANEAMNLAHERLEKVGDQQSVNFAAAVLRFLIVIEPEIEKAKVNDFFWIRTGTLAGSAAAAAYANGNLAEARALVLGGTQRWQTEAYWHSHPAHDALAAKILHESGETQEALRRLKLRPYLDEDMQRVLDAIEKDVRRRRGG
jgi:hypothetical protein